MSEKAAGADAAIDVCAQAAGEQAPAYVRIAKLLPRISGPELAYLAGVVDGLTVGGSYSDPEGATA